MKYEPSPQMLERIENDYTYHPPFGDQAERYVAIRAKAKDMALFLAATCPPSRELSVALTNLDEVVMWSNAAIARNEKQA
ncbi:MAG: hypothetical protein AB7G11_11120 [Phycisphaerales bacterium]